MSFRWLLVPFVTTTAFKSFCDVSNYELEWSDEFDGGVLDTAKWSTVCSTDESGNCEAPFPTHAANDHGAECRSATCVTSAVSVVDGALVLTSARDPNNSSLWTTGAVKTKSKAEWTTDDGTYRMCVSAKLPGGGAQVGAGQGIWPAHWMMPSDDPCDPDEGEMDIFEMVSGSGVAESTYHWQTGWPNVTCAYPDGHEEVWGEMSLGSAWYEDWHEFAVERSNDSIVFAIDGVIVVNSSWYDPTPMEKCETPYGNGTCIPTDDCTDGSPYAGFCNGDVDNQCCVVTSVATLADERLSHTSHHGNEVRRRKKRSRSPQGPRSNLRSDEPGPVEDIKLWPIPFYLILNSAVGGGWPGEPDERTISPTYHMIDYVRLVRQQQQSEY